MTDLAFFQNRLTKNARHLRKWAARNEVYAYRLYDCDIPEFPVIIDIYEAESAQSNDASPISWLHFQEVDTGWRQSEAEHREWIDLVASTAAQTLAVEPGHTAIKLRARQRPRSAGAEEKGEQHQATGRRGEDLIVREGGHRFIVNLQNYLDTGLFLDHRKTRRMVGELAGNKRFLNLFGYSGSFSVYAAGGSAKSTVTVDLSNTYSDWAERNLALNRADPGAHKVVRADVFAWLRDAVDAQQTYDLIVLDPPSFSNSKKMLGVLDVQRDHPWLIRQCLALLSRDGELFFSTNLRSFKLDELVRTKAQFTEISAATVPEDFRDKKIHRCWRVRR